MFGFWGKYNCLKSQYKQLEQKAILLIKEYEQLEKHLNNITDKVSLYSEHQTTPRKQKMIAALDDYRKYKKDLAKYYYPDTSILNSIITFIQQNRIG